MEQHKVLIIMVSVTLAFAAVVGIGMAFFYPRAAEDPMVLSHDAAVDSGRTFDPIEFIRSPQTAPDSAELLREEPRRVEDDVIIIYGVDESLPQTPAERRPRVSDTPQTVAPVTEPASEPAPAPRQAEPTAPAPEPRPPAAPRPPATRAPAPDPEPRQVRVTEYWIQVISSPSRDRVEQARVRLLEQNLGSRITSIEHNNTTFFRLRVGPYSNKAEAEKFLEWIRSVEGFEESYVSEEYPTRTVTG